MRNRTTDQPGPYPKTYKRAGDMLVSRRTRTAYDLAILACIRRIGIDKGFDPVTVESELADTHVRVYHLATSRVLGETVPMLSYRVGDLLVHGIELDELRRVGAFLAKRVRLESVPRFAWYPDGWRADVRFLLGDDVEEQPAQQHGREPGEDDDDG